MYVVKLLLGTVLTTLDLFTATFPIFDVRDSVKLSLGLLVKLIFNTRYSFHFSKLTICRNCKLSTTNLSSSDDQML